MNRGTWGMRAAIGIAPLAILVLFLGCTRTRIAERPVPPSEGGVGAGFGPAEELGAPPSGEDIVRLVKRHVEPASWDQRPDEVSIAVTANGQLLVLHTPAVQLKVGEYLSWLRQCSPEQLEELYGILQRIDSGAASATRAAPAGAEGQEDQPAWAIALKCKLDTIKMDLDFEDASLREVVDFIHDFSGVKVIFAPEVEKEKTPDDRRSFQVTNLVLKNVLKLLCDQYGLAYKVHEEGLQITKPELVAGAPVLQLHDIRDIIRPITDFPGPNVELMPPGRDSGVGAGFGPSGRRPWNDSNAIHYPDNEYWTEVVEKRQANGPAAGLPAASGTVKSDPIPGTVQDGISFRRGESARGPWVPAPGEELWVIERTPEERNRPQDDDQTPRTGAMIVRRPDRPPEEREVPMPLRHTDVKARIDGYIATVDVTQKFQNPFDTKIEAVYVFPLPSNAAVNEFVMTIGDRKIRGIIREREEARQIYDEAKRAGHTASLLTQERPNIFTQSVANIEPQKSIDVNIRYFHTLAWVDGSYEFVFPMVVGPRFNPPGFTEGVGAVGRGSRGASGQPVEVAYLRPGERSGHDISLDVEIDAGVSIEEITSVNHAIEQEKGGTGRAHVRLSALDSVPNKDFVLRYKVAGSSVKTALVTHRDERGGFFTLMLFPPADLQSTPRHPMEMIFVLDCSGSMDGAPIAKAKTALKRALARLGPDDTFQVVRFSEGASQLGAAPVPATPDNVRRATEYVDSLEGEGGTMMIEGIRAALGFPHDPRRLRVVSFMTDGYIGNEVEIFGEISRLIGPARLFSFGVGTSVNRYLMEGMARIGNGAVAYVGLDESGGQEVDAFYERLAHPAMTDLSIDWGGMQVTDVYPKRLPDLMVGRPIVLTGRFAGKGPQTVKVRGRAAGEDRVVAVECAAEAAHPGEGVECAAEAAHGAGTHEGIASVWARTKIADLSDFSTAGGNRELVDETRRTALEYGLVSAYTSFIAVDSSIVTAGLFGTTIQVASPIPDGVKYETTVQEK